MEEHVQGAVAHELSDDAEKLRLIADAEYLYNVVKSGLVEHLSFLQQAVPLSETQPEKTCSYVNRRKGYMTLAQLMG